MSLKVNSKGPLIDLGVCRCCGASKPCRIINAEYQWCGQKEIYSDMFFDCFGLLLSQLDGEPEDRLICAMCVARLREATAFKKQVLNCEQDLLLNAIHGHNADTEKSDLKNGIVKVEFEENCMDSQNVDIKEDFADAEPMDDVDIIKSDTEVKGKKKSVKSKKKTKMKIASKKKNKKIKESNIKVEYPLRKISRNGSRSGNKRMSYNVVTENIENSQPDNDLKCFRNTVTIVENSYVCPFDTSFSDYFCIYCRDVFTEPERLRDHTMNHDPGTYKDLVLNKKIVQIDVLRVDCRLCPKKINDVESLKEHLQTEHEKSFYETSQDFLKFKLTLTNLTCTECGVHFSFFHALKKHMAEHFGSCICDQCGAHYFDERMLVLHQKTHQRVEETFECHCGKVFKSKHTRYLHEARIHKKEAAYQCSKCDEVLFSYSLRYRHMMEVHGERRLFPCEFCERAYVSRKSLREHNRRSHLKILKHQCDLCDKRFYLPSRLKEHMSSHTGERNYRCEYCGKSYPRLRGLKVHMQSHSNEKKYGCQICNASFTQNCNLKNHVKRHHQGLEMDEFHE